jgi:transcriptional regulator with XRE-family HTH domain
MTGVTLTFDLGTLIGVRRIELGWSQKHLADILDVSPQYANDIEHLRRKPTGYVFLRNVASAMDLDLDVLCFAAGVLPPDLPDNVSVLRIKRAFAAMREELER